MADVEARNVRFSTSESPFRTPLFRVTYVLYNQFFHWLLGTKNHNAVRDRCLTWSCQTEGKAIQEQNFPRTIYITLTVLQFKYDPLHVTIGDQILLISIGW